MRDFARSFLSLFFSFFLVGVYLCRPVSGLTSAASQSGGLGVDLQTVVLLYWNQVSLLTGETYTRR